VVVINDTALVAWDIRWFSKLSQQSSRSDRVCSQDEAGLQRDRQACHLQQDKQSIISVLARVGFMTALLLFLLTWLQIKMPWACTSVCHPSTQVC
jgi:hypothetical protein